MTCDGKLAGSWERGGGQFVGGAWLGGVRGRGALCMGEQGSGV